VLLPKLFRDQIQVFFVHFPSTEDLTAAPYSGKHPRLATIGVRYDRGALRHRARPPIGGCDSPHPASNAAAAQHINGNRPALKRFIRPSPEL
jgi:hypothetical protein